MTGSATTLTVTHTCLHVFHRVASWLRQDLVLEDSGASRHVDNVAGT
jgi:hypothetical protein